MTEREQFIAINTAKPFTVLIVINSCIHPPS